MTLAVFHDFPGLENGLTKFHDFPGRVVTLHTILKNFSAMPTHTVNICVPSFIEIHLQNEKEF